MTAEGGPLHRFNDSTISEHAKAFGVVSSVSDSSCQRENLPLFRKLFLGAHALSCRFRRPRRNPVGSFQPRALTAAPPPVIRVDSCSLVFTGIDRFVVKN